MNSPLISVVIPTLASHAGRPTVGQVQQLELDRARYVGDAIESVLGQTWLDRELIVVGNGPTEDTAEVVAGFGDRVRFGRAERQSVGSARNAGVALATGEFLSFLDDDDLWVEDKLSLQVKAFEASPELDAVYGHMEQFASPDLDEAEQARFRRLDGKVVPATVAGTMLIRRAAFDRVGPFDESLRIGVEVDWYARLCEAGLRTAMLDTVVLRRRLHRSNSSVRFPGEQSERLRVLKQALDRRRAAAARRT